MTLPAKNIIPQLPESDILLDISAEKTDFPLLYRCREFKPDPMLPTIVCLTGTTASGKDTLLKMLVQETLVQHVQTATSRKRRYKLAGTDDTNVQARIAECTSVDQYNSLLNQLETKDLIYSVEPENSHIWMRWQRPDETMEDYHKALIAEYDLLESDIHYNSVYGLPRGSLEQAFASKGAIPVIRTDINGVETVNNLFTGRGVGAEEKATEHNPSAKTCNILNIGIIPDSWKQIEEALRNRASSGTSDQEVKKRIQEDRHDIGRFGKLLNYVIQNTRGTVSGRPGLEYSVELLKRVITGRVETQRMAN